MDILNVTVDLKKKKAFIIYFISGTIQFPENSENL